MLDRTTPPENNPLETIELLQPRHRKLSGGTELYYIDAPGAGVVRIEFIFPRLSWDAGLPVAHSVVAGMLLEGTRRHTAAEIAETIDYYGAFLNAESGADHSILTLHCLNKHLSHTLPIVLEVLTEAIFPEQELEVYCRNSRQRLQISLEKNEFVARRAFNEQVFGPQNPYGYPVGTADFQGIDREVLPGIYHRQYRQENCTILAAGKVEGPVLEEIERLFDTWGAEKGGGGRPSPYEAVLRPAGPGKRLVEKAGSLQSAIRIGKPLISRSHPDYPAMQVLNTILGGYFGSRLMANIREEKGYTYGIGSGLRSMRREGVFFIATEVGAEVRGPALKEIYSEIERLREEPVPSGELVLVRNYMLGTFLGSLENVFSHADKFKTLLLSGLDEGYYERYLATIRTVTPDRLQELARTYLDDGFYEVVVG